MFRLIPPVSSSSSGLPVDTGAAPSCELSWRPVTKPDKETLDAAFSPAIRRTQVDEEGRDETVGLVVEIGENGV